MPVTARGASRPSRRALDAVLLLDKPRGPSSNDALQRVRRALNAAKAGHGGTLDPLADGLLPIAFGEATKFLHDMLDADKTYEAELLLGVATEGADAEGAVLARRPLLPAGTPGEPDAVGPRDDAAIAAACAAFVGAIEQVPPMQSALKHRGRPLYAYAREGTDVERAPRRVVVHAIELLAVDRADPAFPRVRLRVHVGKGTYVRALVRDVGDRLGCGATLTALRRTRVGLLAVDDAVPLAQLEAEPAPGRERWLRPVDTLLGSLPRVDVGPSVASRFAHGQRVVLEPAARHGLLGLAGGPVRVYDGQRLVGTAEFVPPGLLAPRRVLAGSHAAPRPG